MAREAKERARREAEEKAHLEEEERAREVEEKARLEEEERAREAAEKAVDEAAVAAEAEAKAKVDAEEVSHINMEEAAKARDDALTQREKSHSGFAPIVLKTLEELQKEQQIMRERSDQQDSVNSNIQNLLTQLLLRNAPPPNP